MPAGVSALFLCLGSPGCASAPHRTAPAPSPQAAVGFVDLRRYLPLHPAAAEIASLDRQILQAERLGSERRPPAEQVPAPRTVPLTVPLPVAEPPAAPREIDRAASRSALREEFEIRRAAQPDPTADAFEEELSRLRRRYEEERDVAPSDDEEQAVQDAAKRAAAISRLESAVRRLAPQPGDRLRYSSDEIRRREEELRRSRQQLDALRRESLARLKAALQRPVRRRPRVPPELLARARQQRDTVRARAEEALRQEERLQVEAAERLTLPAVMPRQVQPSEENAAPAPPASLEKRIRKMAVSIPERGARSATSGALRRCRAELQTAMLEDLRVAALAAGKRAGVCLTFQPGQAPDRTAQLLPEVRKQLLVRKPGAEEGRGL